MSVIAAMYCTLSDGTRGVKCADGVQAGALVTVREKFGSNSWIRIVAIDKQCDGYAYCRIDTTIPNIGIHRGRTQCACGNWHYVGKPCLKCEDE